MKSLLAGNDADADGKGDFRDLTNTLVNRLRLADYKLDHRPQLIGAPLPGLLEPVRA